MGLAIAAILISVLAATSYPAHAALPAHAAIGSSNTPVPAAPSNPAAQAVGTTSVQLTWTNNAANQSGVVISLDGEESVNVQGATVSSYTWNGLTPDTKYWFYVASKIYGTLGDPTGSGNTQSAWVGPVYATTVGTQPSASPAPQPSASAAPQPSTSPAPQPSTSPAPQPSTSPAPQPSTPGSGVPTTLPTQPSPTFVCVTGPGGSCMEPGAGLPVPKSWAPTPPGWLTSPLVGGCTLQVTETAAEAAAALGVALVPGLDLVDLTGGLLLLEGLGDAVLFDESTGKWYVRLTKLMPFKDCAELAYYLYKHQPPPQDLNFQRSVGSPRSGDMLDSVDLPDREASTPSLFQPMPESQLASLTKLPLLRQRFGYAVAQVGAAAALSQKYPAVWGAAEQKSVVCRPQQGGYRCAWSYQLNGAHHSGYVLVAVTANNYRLGKVAGVAQAAPASPASSLSPLWYISIAAVVVIVAIVVAALRRRRRADGSVHTTPLDGNNAVSEGQEQAMQFDALAGAVTPGTSQAPPEPADPAARLRKLQDLRDAGLLTADEYQAKRAEILESL